MSSHLQMKTSPERRQGFTLLEILIALTIFSAGVIITSVVLTNVTRTIVSATNIDIVSSILHQRLAEISLGRYSPGSSAYTPHEYPDFSITTETKQIKPHLDFIIVKVEWPEGGKTKQIVVSTYHAKAKR